MESAEVFGVDGLVVLFVWAVLVLVIVAIVRVGTHLHWPRR